MNNACKFFRSGGHFPSNNIRKLLIQTFALLHDEHNQGNWWINRCWRYCNTWRCNPQTEEEPRQCRGAKYNYCQVSSSSVSIVPFPILVPMAHQPSLASHRWKMVGLAMASCGALYAAMNGNDQKTCIARFFSFRTDSE